MKKKNGNVGRCFLRVVVVVKRDRDRAGLWSCVHCIIDRRPYLGQLCWNRFFRVRFRHVRVPGLRVPVARRTRWPRSTCGRRGSGRYGTRQTDGADRIVLHDTMSYVFGAGARCSGPARRPIEANAGRAQWPPPGILFRPLKSLGRALRRRGQGRPSASRNDRLGPHFGRFLGRQTERRSARLEVVDHESK